jgi:hypothetical protein
MSIDYARATLKAVLTVTVKYNQPRTAENIEMVTNLLEQANQYLVDNGMLTGETELEADDWNHKIEFPEGE